MLKFKQNQLCSEIANSIHDVIIAFIKSLFIFALIFTIGNYFLYLLLLISRPANSELYKQINLMRFPTMRALRQLTSVYLEKAITSLRFIPRTCKFIADRFKLSRLRENKKEEKKVELGVQTQFSGVLKHKRIRKNIRNQRRQIRQIRQISHKFINRQEQEQEKQNFNQIERKQISYNPFNTQSQINITQVRGFTHTKYSEFRHRKEFLLHKQQILKHHLHNNDQNTCYRYRFQYASCQATDPNKYPSRGQDAILVSDNILVVADGVGGWRQLGIDSGKYSRNLCAIIRRLYCLNPYQSINNPQKLIQDAVQLNSKQGTTTVTVFALHPELGTVKVFYVGDSTFGFFNDNFSQIFPIQQKYFNSPQQIGQKKIPEGLSQVFEYDDIKDKVLVVASDGLWDNVHSDVIKEHLCSSTRNLRRTANSLCDLAQVLSKKGDYSSPFYERALKYGLKIPMKGKMDDISLILAKVVKEQYISTTTI